MVRLLCASALAVLALAAAPAAAQETRAELLAREREQKAARLQRYQPGGVEKGLLFVEQTNLLHKIAPYNGFYVQYGYSASPVGTGLAIGGGFRHDLFGGNARLVTEAGLSVRAYQLYRVDFSLPRLAGHRLELGVEGLYRRNPQEDFYGRGMASGDDDRVNFLFKGPEAQARLVFKPVGWARVGAKFGYLDPTTGRGRDPRFPSIEARFGDDEAPGLLAQPTYTYTELFAAADGRDEPGNARAGGYYAVSWRKYNDSDLDAFGFHRVELELQHFFPFLHKKRVVVVRGHVEATTADEGHRVPFYMMPSLGGSNTLRSTSDYRFRDNNLLLMNVEYRWEAFSGLDMALFTDFGKVAREAGDLDFTGLERAYGIGFRFNTARAVFLRLDVGHGGDEGLKLYLKFSRAF